MEKYSKLSLNYAAYPFLSRALVEPVNQIQAWEDTKLAFVHRWPLFGGSGISVMRIQSQF